MQQCLDGFRDSPKPSVDKLIKYLVSLMFLKIPAAALNETIVEKYNRFIVFFFRNISFMDSI